MAITGSTAKVSLEAKDNLISNTVDTSVFGGSIGVNNTTGILGAGDPVVKLAGVTPEMAQNIATALQTYSSEITTILDRLDAVDSTGAFKGTSIGKALETFVLGVKAISKDYLTQLENAANTIVSSVAAAYEAQDTDLSSQLNTDSQAFLGVAPEGGISGPTTNA